MGQVILYLDESTARDLFTALYLMGEHIAAGMPFPELPVTFHEHIAAILKELDHQLPRNDEPSADPPDKF